VQASVSGARVADEPRVHGALHYIEMELGKCELFLYGYWTNKAPNQLITQHKEFPQKIARRLFR
jgi:hypothetical protein